MSKVVLTLLTGIIAFSFLGCAATPPTSSERTLLSAGFRVRAPETPRQKEIFAKLTAYRVHQLTVKGHSFYVYKDEGKGIALVGREAEYQRYREMARQDQQTANIDRAMAMEDAAARSWSSEYALERDWR